MQKEREKKKRMTMRLLNYKYRCVCLQRLVSHWTKRMFWFVSFRFDLLFDPFDSLQFFLVKCKSSEKSSQSGDNI